MTTMRVLIASGVIASLSGCASLGSLQSPASDDYDVLLQAVKDRANQYANYAAQFDHSAFAYDVGMALLAAGSVAAAVFSHGAARGNLLAGIGIGAGGATVLWSAAKPEEKRSAYRLARLRAECVYTNGKQLAGAPQLARAGQLSASVKGLETEIAAVEDGIAKAQPTAKSAQDAAVIVAANLALQKGQAAKDSATDEINAFVNRNAVVWNALVTIDAQADDTSKTVIITLSDAKNAMTSAQGAPGGSAALVAPAAPAEKDLQTANVPKKLPPIEVLRNATTVLSIDADKVGAQKYFTPSIAKIQGCPGMTTTLTSH